MADRTVRFITGAGRGMGVASTTAGGATLDEEGPVTDPHDLFPTGFFARADESADDQFYVPDRFVTHIDDRAIVAVGTLYRHLGLSGSVLDVMSSWVSHFLDRPDELVVLGMNGRELGANTMAHATVVHDLNVDPVLPFPDDRFDAITCCVSIDYLVRPIAVLRDAARVVRPGGVVVCTFSNRCFPTKVVQGWLRLDEESRVAAVAEYFRLTDAFDEVFTAMCTPPHTSGDPLYAVWAAVRPDVQSTNDRGTASPSRASTAEQ